jgi:hypothetical protein
MTVAIVSCSGLGDGLISLLLANNFHINQKKVEIFHSGVLHELQSFFPHIEIKPFPNKVDDIFLYDQIFVFYDFSNSFVKEIIVEGKKRFPKKVVVINASFSSRVGFQPFYEDTFFIPILSMVENIELFCKRILHLSVTTKETGWILPSHISYNKDLKKVILHASGAKEEKRWPIEKFLSLYRALDKKGWSPLFVFSQKEKSEWAFLEKENVSLRFFPSCEDLAKEILSASYMIGNDSGVGHLASAFHIPTISIFCHKRKSLLWRPGFYKGEVVYPSPYIPNISLFRIRDIYWKKWVPVCKVFSAFNRISK